MSYRMAAKPVGARAMTAPVALVARPPARPTQLSAGPFLRPTAGQAAPHPSWTAGPVEPPSYQLPADQPEGNYTVTLHEGTHQGGMTLVRRYTGIGRSHAIRIAKGLLAEPVGPRAVMMISHVELPPRLRAGGGAVNISADVHVVVDCNLVRAANADRWTVLSCSIEPELFATADRYRQPAIPAGMGRMGAFGYDIEVDTPLGPKTVTFDLEKVSKDVSDALIAQAWPQLESRARAALPSFVDDAIAHAQPTVDAEIDSAKKTAALLVGLFSISVLVGAYYIGSAPASSRMRKQAAA